ncbi:MAG: MaoC family dehydratase [Deltaproteobacteria bacterium]|nr:MAG: MaoC family dehydratase [Deltaproteobacteria bacterium]
MSRNEEKRSNGENTRVIDGRESFGRYYEDFQEGDIIRHFPGRTVTEYDDTLFTLLTMNQHPLHLDEHYAKETEWGQRLVTGYFSFALVYGMTVRDLSGKTPANLGIDRIRFLKPVFHGDSLYAESRVIAKRPSRSRPGEGIVTVETRGLNQKGETVLTFERTFLVPMKNPLPERKEVENEEKG